MNLVKISVLFFMLGLVGQAAAESLRIASTGKYLCVHQSDIYFVDSDVVATKDFKVQFVIGVAGVMRFLISIPAKSIGVDSEIEYFLENKNGVLSLTSSIDDSTYILWEMTVEPIADLCHLRLDGIALIRDGRMLASKLC